MRSEVQNRYAFNPVQQIAPKQGNSLCFWTELFKNTCVHTRYFLDLLDKAVANKSPAAWASSSSAEVKVDFVARSSTSARHLAAKVLKIPRSNNNIINNYVHSFSFMCVYCHPCFYIHIYIGIHCLHIIYILYIYAMLYLLLHPPCPCYATVPIAIRSLHYS